MANMTERADRFQSHALVELRKFRWFSWLQKSAVLLDLSQGGFKLEFTAPTTVRSGERLWLTIPLRPLGVMGPPAVVLRIEVKWFDQGRGRVGGIFIKSSPVERMLLAQVMENLRQRGLLV